MTVATALGGPVSTFLETDLREAARKYGVVVWLDVDGFYSAFVDRLMVARQTSELGYEVRAFRGSYLALMMSLEGVAGGVDRAPLVVHLPGFNEETVKQTPLFELYAAGTRYRKALDTLITEAAAGRARPDQISAFKDEPGVTLDRADAWLGALLDGGHGGIAAQLRAMTPTAVLDDLLSAGYVAARIAPANEQAKEDERALWGQLTVWTGLPELWRQMTLPASTVDLSHDRLRVKDIAFAMASWTLSVEYVYDLKRPPVNALLAQAQGLPNSVIATCREVATHLRRNHKSFYERTADETEALVSDEVEAAKPDDLGKIDTFRFEEDKVLEGALASLGTSQWTAAIDWATRRIDPAAAEASFWLQRDPSRKNAWELVHDAARLGHAISRAGDLNPPSGSCDAALEAYVDRGAVVDQAHRHLEQRRVALLYPQLPAFDTLRARLDEMRRTWRHWADRWATSFNATCREHGFLPSASHQQRMIFDEVVKPLAQEAGATAYFVVDAFRFEMGAELFQQLVETPATTVQLKARLAELPTVTEIGMNVLAPVAVGGRLQPSMSNDGSSIQGYSTGEFRVFDSETRKRAMHARVGGASCPWLALDDVVDRDSVSLKRSIAQARLVVVHTREIDNAGEGGVGLAVFDRVMQKLRAAWQLLREAGVRRFVFTGDHGFLLLDEAAPGPQAHGRRIDPKRRHVFSPVAADHNREVRVALADLGYEGVDGHLMFPETTAVFDTGKRPMTFVHGGNSLQERAIPVLTVVHRAAAGGSTLQYGIRAEPRDGIAGMHCLEVTVEVVSQGALDFGTARAIELALRVPDVADVQVELCQTRGKAAIVGGAVQATVGEAFEIFFHLFGPSDERVRVEVHHPGGLADVVSSTPEMRFAVTDAPVFPSEPATGRVAQAGRAAWLEGLESGVRQVFEHLAAHGTVTEDEAAAMLGGPRGLRRFALVFDELVGKAPWSVRIDVVAGVKRYVREGRNG